MIVSQTYEVFAERVRRRLENDWPGTEQTVTNNEIYLFMYDGIATVMTAAARQGYAVDGIYTTPEAFKTTYKFTAQSLVRNWDNDTYELILPHPPLNLPLGYSIENPHFAAAGTVSHPLIAVHGYNSGYYKRMETPDGIFYSVRGGKMIIDCAGLDPIAENQKLYVTMLSPRGETGSESDTINMSQDGLAQVYAYVIEQMGARISGAKDKVNDGSDKKTEAA